MLNRMQAIGNIGKEPETRFTPTGKKVCHFTVAMNRRWTNAAGEKQEATDWINVEAWGTLAELVQQYKHKGDEVYVEGRLQTDQYEVDGQKRSWTKVVASQVIFLRNKQRFGTGAEADEIMVAPGEADYVHEDIQF